MFSRPGPHFRARGETRTALSPMRRFGRDAKGTSAIEFGLIALPFLALMFAIIETALLYFSGQMLETAVQDTARLIRTGQVQQQKLDVAGFRTTICGKLSFFPSCESKLQIDVRTSATFDSANLAAPVEKGELKTDDFTFDAGKSGDIVVVRAFYPWPTFVKLLGQNYSNLADGSHLLSATAAFKNEPFPW